LAIAGHLEEGNRLFAGHKPARNSFCLIVSELSSLPQMDQIKIHGPRRYDLDRVATAEDSRASWASGFMNIQ